MFIETYAMTELKRIAKPTFKEHKSMDPFSPTILFEISFVEFSISGFCFVTSRDFQRLFIKSETLTVRDAVYSDRIFWKHSLGKCKVGRLAFLKQNTDHLSACIFSAERGPFGKKKVASKAPPTRPAPTESTPPPNQRRIEKEILDTILGNKR